MADECDDPRCGAVFPQGHLSGCRNAARPPKGRAGWDADLADAAGAKFVIEDDGTVLFDTMDDLANYLDATRAEGDPTTAEVEEWTRNKLAAILARDANGRLT